MTASTESRGSQTAWFVTTMYDPSNDEMERFLAAVRPGGMQKESRDILRRFGLDSTPANSHPASIYADRWATSPQPKTPALTTQRRDDRSCTASRNW